MEIWDVINSKTAYRIAGNEVWDVAAGSTAYRIDGSDVWDVAAGRTAYRIDGNEVWDVAAGKTVYRINGSDVWDVAAGRTAFRIDGASNKTSGARRESQKPSVFWAFVFFLVRPFFELQSHRGYSVSRKEWWGMLFRMILLFFVLGMILTFAGVASDVAWIITMIIPMIPITVFSIRRMRDIGRPWWWILIPIANFVMCGFYPSKN